MEKIENEEIDRFETSPIEELSDYMKYVENLPNGFVLSRGQTDEYKLLPSALRVDVNGKRKYSKKVINFFLNEFKLTSHTYLKFPWDIKTTYEWMVMAQHYGIPTRLLDFSYSHIVSLMFALEKAFLDSEDKSAEVWFLNPNQLNLKIASRSEILSFGDVENNKIDEYDGPVVVKGRNINDRINSQQGLFVYFQDEGIPLENCVDNGILRRIIIKNSCIE